MRCVFSKFFAFLLLVLCLLLFTSVCSAQCPQGNCPAGGICINGRLAGDILSLPIQITANTAAFAGNTVCNTGRCAANLGTAPLTGSFHNFGYSRQVFNYSPYFQHYQSGGAYTVRSHGFFRRCR